MYKISDDPLIIGQGDTDEKADLHHHQNLRNFQFKCSEVSFIGNVMTRNGLKKQVLRKSKQ